MLTCSRIKQFFRALQLDDDDILGDDKGEILDVISQVYKKYVYWQRINSAEQLNQHLKSIFVKGLPTDIYAEAFDVIVDVIHDVMKQCGLKPNIFARMPAKEIYNLVVGATEEGDHNRLVVAYALGIQKYVKATSKVRKVRNSFHPKESSFTRSRVLMAV